MSDDAAQSDRQSRRGGGTAEAAVTEHQPSAAEDRADEHLADVEEGAGCTEIWEHLSEAREE